jgi:hypothetical protein
MPLFESGTIIEASSVNTRVTNMITRRLFRGVKIKCHTEALKDLEKEGEEFLSSRTE